MRVSLSWSAGKWVGASAIAAMAACSGGPGISVGDPYQGGTVVDIQQGGGCTSITVEYAPNWTCSVEQRAEVGAPSGGGVGEYADGIGIPGSPSSAPPAVETVDLVPTDCESLANLRRPGLKSQLQSTLRSERASQLRANCFGRRETKYIGEQGQSVSYCNASESTRGGGTSTGTGGPALNGVAAPAADAAEGAKAYSTTNNQVAGVDEADFVKNDAEHVFVLSSDGLHVMDAWPVSEAHEVAHVQLAGEPRRLFLYDKRLIAYTRLQPAGQAAGSNPSSQGCTYGYGCRFTSEGAHTLVTVFDVTNPAQPTEIHRYEFSGGYVASRRVGPNIYTVVHDTGAVSVPGANLKLIADGPAGLEAAYTVQLDRANTAVDTMAAGYFLPWVRELDPQGQVKAEVTSCGALASAAAKGMSFVSLVTFDAAALADPRRTLIATKPGFVYASADALYMATDGVDGSDAFYSSSSETDRSTIHKFALSGLETKYAGSASIRGHVLNQFSMDQSGDVLRVATSNGHVPDPGVTSNITTLAERAGHFTRVGELGGIAPHEDIRSVRFDGDRGFVVTFKKTDPLFVIDLAEPTAPRILGELKIPGFSTYMHRMDANHLLAVGFDADDMGSFAYFNGIQIQIFDVTDLAHPALMHKTVIGTRGSGSEALMNHLAFNYFAPKGLLALPMTICEGGGNGMYGDKLTFSGLMVFDVSLASGISVRGRMPFVDATSVGSTAARNAGTCGTWWTNSTSMVKRSIFMDDYAIGISDGLFNVSALGNLTTVLRSLPLVAAKP